MESIKNRCISTEVSSHPAHADRDVCRGELPNLFCTHDGSEITSLEVWEQRRQQLLDVAVPLCFGGLPPKPEVFRAEPLYGHTYRIVAGTKERTVSFELQLTMPTTPGRHPVLLTGDRCAGYCNDEIRRMYLDNGFIIAEFNRAALAEDTFRDDDRTRGLYPVYPDLKFGMIAAWAWGYHRCVDMLLTMGEVDPDHICITGHSRGGKATLLAGATDDRISFTQASGSGMFGCGCFRYTQWEEPEREVQDHHSEDVGNFFHVGVTYSIAHWVGPDMEQYIGHEEDCPADLHFLKAAIAPRWLLESGSVEDIWSNPRGSYQTFRAAREAYRVLGVPERIASEYRYGPHGHLREDFRTFLDFILAAKNRKPFLKSNADAIFGHLPKIHSFGAKDADLS